MDWDSNGTNDLLVGDVNGNVIIYKNTNNNLDSGTFVLNNGGDRATPVFEDWNGDENRDLLVGNLTGTIQVYLNEGNDENPSFSSYNNLKVGGIDFDLTTTNCQTQDCNDRSAPRIYDWNRDGLKDILVGERSGYIYYLENIGTDSAPVFNSYEKLSLLDGSDLRYISSPFSASPRSRLDIVDWNNDGLPDIVAGGNDGRVMLFTAAAPEPVSTTLFIVGGVVLGLSRLRKKLKDRSN